MNEPRPNDNTLVISLGTAEPITVVRKDSDPFTLRLDVETSCTCSSRTTVGPGSYVYTDPIRLPR